MKRLLFVIALTGAIISTLLVTGNQVSAGSLVKIGSGAYSNLSVTVSEVNLTFCGSNVPHYTAYVNMYRGWAGSNPPRSWSYIVKPDGSLQTAYYINQSGSRVYITSQLYSYRSSSNCTTIRNMDGTYNTFDNITYSTSVALNGWPDSGWNMNGCYSQSGGYGLCDSASR